MTQPASHVLPYDLGIEVSAEGAPDCFVCIIPKGTPYPTPAAFRQTFRTTAESQDLIRLPVCLADVPDAGDRLFLGVIDYSPSPPLPPGTPVEVAFAIESADVLNVEILA